MKYIVNKRFFNYRFDFDIGHLIKSPCKDCDERKNFPHCIDACDVIDRIHEILSESVSCSKG